MSVEFTTIAEAGRALKARKISATELTRHLLQRIEKYDPALHSFITVTRDRALKAAETADREIGQGKYRGPLHGIPLALKDVINVAGVRTTAHSKILLGYVPKKDSTAWRRLEDAGAVLLGKLATHEFAIGGPDPELPFPPALNPWNSGHFTGGSSSGSGVAVAAGLTLGALGTDSGGSVRTPSAHCGLVGLKPTYGLVSRDGVLPLAPSLDSVGPMTWTVEDNALLLQTMVGGDSGDVTRWMQRSPKGMRIGYAAEFDKTANVTPDGAKAVDGFLQTLTTLGAHVETVSLPPLQDLTDCARLILMTESFAVHEKKLRALAKDYGGIVRGRLLLAGLVNGSDYVQAVKWRRELAAQMTRAMAGFDAIVTAATPSAAPKVVAVPKFALIQRPPLVFPFNLIGAPALVQCCGFSADGLPLGVQIAGAPFSEAKLYGLANAYEQATSWRKKRPVLTPA